jgi:hypothetical protein
MAREPAIHDAEALVRKALSRLGHHDPDDTQVKTAAAKIVKAHPLPRKKSDKAA